MANYIRRVRNNGVAQGEYEAYALSTKLYDPGAMSVSVRVRSGYLAAYVINAARECLLNDPTPNVTKVDPRTALKFGLLLEEAVKTKVWVDKARKREGVGVNDAEQFSEPLVLAAVAHGFIGMLGERNTKKLARIMKNWTSEEDIPTR